MANRLAQESSPYLQQHKDNPVDWYPWGKEAIDLAKAENKPIFISIGYSTCHWCHVMARESFEDEDTASYMNTHFVNIKIDREEYPGVDKAYQEMYQMMHQRGGGWPLSVWAYPDGTPFYLGTYFPIQQKYGIPSFMEVNTKLIEAWQDQQNLLEQQSQRLTNALNNLHSAWKANPSDLTEDLYYKEIISLQKRFDHKFGGIGGAPKFPRVSTLRYLLQEGVTKEIDDMTDFVSFTFYQMAKGGIYDQLGGGFSRYSVDAQWLVPHFEKMLYDNGALLLLAGELYAISKDPFIEFILRDTVAWMAREMRDPAGGFYAAQNAESEGREGKYYVWTEDEIDTLLGKRAELAKHRFGITKKGNFEDPHHPEISGMNVLSITSSITNLAEQFNISEDSVVLELNAIRKTMFDYRSKRIKPSTDTKIITSWNCLAIRGLFATAQYLQFPEAGKLAIDALEFILSNLVTEDRVIRRYNALDTGNGGPDGVLDDYSFLIAALIDAYEYTANYDYVSKAEDISTLALQKFYNQDNNLFYFNPKGTDDLFKSVVQPSDDSMASGLGIMVSNLFKLGKYTENEDLVDKGKLLITSMVEQIQRYPGAMSTLLISGSLYLRYPHEFVLVKDSANFEPVIQKKYLPGRLLYRSQHNGQSITHFGVFEHRLDVDLPTVYICKGQTCSLPITTVENLEEELSK